MGGASRCREQRLGTDGQGGSRTAVETLLFDVYKATGVISATLPHTTTPHWTDRIRCGAASFGIALTLDIALVLGLLALVAMPPT